MSPILKPASAMPNEAKPIRADGAAGQVDLATEPTVPGPGGMLINLQLLRFFAAMAVLLYHAADHYKALGGAASKFFILMHAIGYAGVDVFFVISGFIIWHTTERLEGFKPMLDFMYRRLARIYLGYWPYFLLVLGVFYAFKAPGLQQADLIGSFFLTLNLSPQLLLKVAWSLHYELYFYAVFSFLVLFSLRFRKTVVMIAFLSVLGLQLYAWLVWDSYRPEHILHAPAWLVFYTSPFTLEFMAGCLLAILVRSVGFHWLWVLASVALSVLLVGLALYFEKSVGVGLQQGYFIVQRIVILGGAATCLVFAMLMLERGGIQLLPRFSLLFGGASYSLYLSHTIILFVFYASGMRAQLSSYPGWHMAGMTAVVVVIIVYSVVHYRYIERPLYRLAKRFQP